MFQIPSPFCFHPIDYRIFRIDIGEYPLQFNSVYEMVSFSHTSYATALRCQQAQDKLLAWIMSRGAFETLVEQTPFKEELNQRMQQYADEVASFV